MLRFDKSEQIRQLTIIGGDSRIGDRMGRVEVSDCEENISDGLSPLEDFDCNSETPRRLCKIQCRFGCKCRFKQGPIIKILTSAKAIERIYDFGSIGWSNFKIVRALQ